MAKINYVIALWGAKSDADTNLKIQIDLLNKIDHNLAQVTLVSPPYEGSHLKFENLLTELEGTTLSNGAPIVLIRRDANKNMSYGSFSDAFGAYRQEFDYYIFMEDDYIPARPRFDQLLVDILKIKGCHYLCMLVSNTTFDSRGIPHAGVTVGICDAAAMETIWQKHGSLLSDDFPDWYWHNQMNFSYPYHYCGFKIADFSDAYAITMWYMNGLKELIPGPARLLVPIQMQNMVIYGD